MAAQNPPLPFEDLIGAPLRAIIAAQAQSASATHEFILNMTESVQDGQTLKNVKINYERMSQDMKGGTITKAESLTVPLLTLVPVPYLNVDEAEVNFNAKIIMHTIEESKQGLPKKISLYSTYSSKKTEDVTSDLQVKIKIKRDEIPEGLAKTLSVMNNAINVKSE